MHYFFAICETRAIFNMFLISVFHWIYVPLCTVQPFGMVVIKNGSSFGIVTQRVTLVLKRP